MPTYQYACTDPETKHEFEVVQSFTDPAVTVCPECGAPVRKVYGSVGVVFKGSGFYRTDSRDSKSGTSSSAKEGSAKEGSAKESSSGSTGKESGSSSGGKDSGSSSGSSGTSTSSPSSTSSSSGGSGSSSS